MPLVQNIRQVSYPSRDQHDAKNTWYRAEDTSAERDEGALGALALDRRSGARAP